ncbi:MAG: hypothetical protein ACTSQ4_02315 [Candidatus Heimdallarchaeaceae archaeon]
MRMQILQNMMSVMILVISLTGIGFGGWAVLNGFYIGLISLGGGMMGIGVFAMSLLPPLGYSSWDEWENPFSYRSKK